MIEFTTTPAQVAKFWRYVEKTESGCWNWTASRSPKGYGVTTATRRSGGYVNVRAHRLSFYIHHGRCPADKLILHHCDNPSCVNPDHLYEGTALQNSSDMVRRGRSTGSLSEADVLEIRRLRATGMLVCDIAARFGMSQHGAWCVVSGESWKHLPTERNDCPLRFTEEQVLEIRRLWGTGEYVQRELAERYGTTQQTISRMVHGKSWKHLPLNRPPATPCEPE